LIGRPVACGTFGSQGKSLSSSWVVDDDLHAVGVWCSNAKANGTVCKQKTAHSVVVSCGCTHMALLQSGLH
jgi:hypothetical protein